MHDPKDYRPERKPKAYSKAMQGYIDGKYPDDVKEDIYDLLQVVQAHALYLVALAEGRPNVTKKEILEWLNNVETKKTTLDNKERSNNGS
ncbi:MAG: hypothetical protein ACXABY_16480 [Candidatus Thorarchaeota archaeon]|jgi:hypothetical protein